MPKITVIIPGCTSELYLERCIQSLQHQTFQDFEILLVIDESQKSKKSVCDTFDAKEFRIHIVYSSHIGLSARKNAGLDWALSKSNSEWISFIDIDDTVHPLFLQSILEAAETNQASISACGLVSAEEKIAQDEGCCNIYIRKTPEYYLNKMSAADTLKGKLFKKDCFNNVRFPEGKTYEDEYIVYRLLFQYDYIPVTEKNLYICTYDTGEISSTGWTLDARDILEATENQISFFARRQYDNIAKIKMQSLIRYNLAFQELVLKCDRLASDEKARYIRLCRKQLRRILIQYRKYHWITYYKSSWAKQVYANAFTSIRIGREAWGKLKRILASTPAERLLKRGAGDVIAERDFHLAVSRYKKHIANTKVVLLQTPVHGNLGDHAIAQAEIEMLQKLSISYAECPWTKGIEEQCAKETHSRETVLIHGGGFMGQLWPVEEKRLRDSILAFHNNRIIILPQTVYFDLNTEEGMRCFRESKTVYDSHPDLTLFLREENSYRFMRTFMPEIHVQLVPDIALMLNWNPLSLERQGALICMRRDKEKTLSVDDFEKVSSILSNSYEKKIMSDTVISGDIDLSKRSKALDEKLREFSSASLVVTDRLHGMIFAAITETPCIVLDSLSPKIRGCYEWIKDLDYIRFAENVDDVPDIIEDLKTVTPHYDRVKIEEAMQPLYNVLIEATK